jgi:L-aspartate oxidase
MAWRAGAALLDMEFVQFHPTALAVAGAPRFLVSEAVRGEGAHLRNAAGERFTDELAARDQVARAIVREVKAGRGPVTLDLTPIDAEKIRTRFPRILATCARYGIDITTDPVPVTPAAHYVMGGVTSDLWGRTSLPGLYAAGEAAGTGVHGANRLASNSLLEGLVFGARAAEAMAGDELPEPAAPAEPPASSSQDGPGADPAALAERVREGAWRALGLERDAEGLRALLAELEGLRAAPSLPTRSSAEARNLADVAWAMATCALSREESRGGHFRRDFPQPDEARFHGHTLLGEGRARLVEADLPQGAAPLFRARTGAPA